MTILKYEYYDSSGNLGELSFFEFPNSTPEEVQVLHKNYQADYNEYNENDVESEFNEEDVNTFDHWLNFKNVPYTKITPDLTIVD